MELNRFLLIEFLDGKKESFYFPTQADTAMARKFRMEDFLKGQFITIQVENELLLYPVSAIRSIRMSGLGGPALEEFIGSSLPISTIRGAEQNY
ncbi:hypothetical protein VVD49_18650 [Uliginosibacterium sp. H3]|uniref:Uncharacterized protein n=1 Tax=Uliginosibacterium silvisoli TaxID=3114758 RepID=A0ABU6K787_9RHOO|nr:hypothetical protein [Uliginosibacterium sp. H3]